MQHLKTQDFRSACEVMGIDPNLSFDHLPEPYRIRSLKSHKRDVVADGINKERDFVINHTNREQRTYIPIFRKNSFGRWYYYSYNNFPLSIVSSYLVFDSYDSMIHFVEIILKENLMDE